MTVVWADGSMKNFRVECQDDGHYGVLVVKDGQLKDGIKTFQSINLLAADTEVQRAWNLK